MAFLRDSLRPASFRGVGFQVDGSGLEAGRRNQIHEYPQKDQPYIQDLGRGTRRIEVEAFVVGADYVAQAGSLLAAIETAGPGALVHPWLGSMQVSVLGCRVSFDKGLGVARFALSFVEAGLLEFPTASSSTAAASRTQAGGLLASLQSSFAGVFKTLGYINYVANQAIVYYGKVLTVLANPTFALSSALGFSTLPGNLTSLANLISNPSGLIAGFTNLVDLSGKAKSGALGTTDAALIPIIANLTNMASSVALAAPASSSYATATMQQDAANQAAVYAAARQALLVQAIGISSYLQCSVYDDTNAVKVQLAAALDAETLLTDDDDLYQSLMDARAAMWNDLTTRSENSARLTTLTPPMVLPMLAIAYDYYQDAGRADEMIARNKIINPGFVPVETLLVLSQ